MIDTLRLFIAAELPDDVLMHVKRVQTLLKKELTSPALRWAHPSSIHLTLKFLGDVPVTQVEGVEAVLDEAAANHDPLELDVQGMGCFPNFQRPNVVWLGIKGDVKGLKALQTTIEMAMADLGFDPESRNYTPHLTLARVQRNTKTVERKAIGAKVEEWQEVRVTNWRVASISLMQSELKPTGAEYSQMHHVLLEE